MPLAKAAFEEPGLGDDHVSSPSLRINNARPKRSSLGSFPKLHALTSNRCYLSPSLTKFP